MSIDSLSRRQFVLSGLAAAVAPEPIRLCVLSEDSHRTWDIAELLDDLGIELESMALSSAVEPARFALLWIPCATYPAPTELPPVALATVTAFLAAGKGVFAEYVVNFPGAPAGRLPLKTGIARLFAERDRMILDEHDSLCLPMNAGEPPGSRRILSFGRVAGVGRVSPRFEVKDTWAGLIAGDRWALATTSLSEYRRRRYAPLSRWQDFLRQLILDLLPEPERTRAASQNCQLRAHTEPRVFALPGTQVRVVGETAAGARVSPLRPTAEGRHESLVTPSGEGLHLLKLEVSHGGRRRGVEVPLRVSDRRTAYRRALERNIRWYERSGALLRPDGTLGVAEWVSGPDIEGRRIAYATEQEQSPERADCVFESALAFWLYGKLAPSPSHGRTAENMLVRIMDFQRLGRSDPGYGLWNTRGRGGQAFPDDISWATICSLAGYRYTRNRLFLDRGLLSAGAQARASGPDDRQRVPMWANTASHRAMSEPVDLHPHIGGCVLSAWLYTYGMTGDKSYLELALPKLRKMIAGFPKIRRYVISQSCEAARFLLPLALACAYTDDPAFPAALRDQAAYLRSCSDPCGAIQEKGSNIGDRVEGGDLGLTYDENETISDQLYCTSFAAMNFWIAWKATGERAYLDDYHRIADYLVRIQVESPDPMIDGGWMRGFDYALWEYYGANADQAWNAYVLETGWTNAIIDIALGLYLIDDSFFAPRR